ncbi:MAG: serine/threonine-protein phosphatase [Kiritimatiellae bacterium]|nr:serine/threonine-protein phosphatase [Kiritimatiellia bacterium]
MFNLFGRGDKPLFPFATAKVTDRGFVRRANEDSFLDRPEDGFFCVSDGMGGGSGGALASRWICEALAGMVDAEGGSAFEIKQFALVKEIQRVNDRIRAYAKENGYRMMGATLALLLVDRAAPERAMICHAGDSRIYRLREGELKQLTRDHTVGSELGRALSENLAERAADLQSRRNPLTHILTRAIGTELRARPDLAEIDVRRGDRFLLCSDGVHDMLEDPEIAAVLKDALDPAAAIESLSAAVRSAGATDNFTMICAYA